MPATGQSPKAELHIMDTIEQGKRLKSMSDG